mgnify:CR=1 FL=1
MTISEKYFNQIIKLSHLSHRMLQDCPIISTSKYHKFGGYEKDIDLAHLIFVIKKNI